MQCTHCGSKKYMKNGTHQGVQRYVCKQCGRKFSDKVRKFTYEDKARCVDMCLNNVGIRKAARFTKCAPSLVLIWLKEFAENLKRETAQASNRLDDKLPDIIEMDEIYTRVKKGAIEHRYGLLILDGEMKLLRMSSAEDASVQ